MDLRRCPHCSAALRPDAAWCGLCYADLRSAAPARPPVVAPGPVLMPVAEPADDAAVRPAVTPAITPAPAAPPTSPSTGTPAVAAPEAPTRPADVRAAGWPCSRCSLLVPLTAVVCPACGAAFLAPLAGDGGRHRLSGGVGAGSRAGSRTLPRPARLVAGAFVGLVVAILVPVLLALLG